MNRLRNWSLKRLVLLAGAILIMLSLGLVLAVSCKYKEQVASDGIKKVQVHDSYTCPMHPQIKMDGPGQCPICGMTLVKALDEDKDQAKNANVALTGQHAGHGGGTPAALETENATPGASDHVGFRLSQARQQMIGVQTGTVEKKPVFKSIRAAGRLAFDPELYTAQNEYLEAIKQVERVRNSPIAEVRNSAERMMESAKLRLKVMGLSDQQIAQIGSQESSGANLLIHKPGQSVWVYAEIYEMDLPEVKAGQSAEITARFLGGQVLAGKVMSVDRVINPNTRTANARILLPNGKAVLRPESYVDVTIHAPLGEQLVVPFDAILDTGKQAWVFVVKGNGEFEPRAVAVKFYADDMATIASGLQTGEQIVTSGNFLIDSESRLKAVQAAAGGPSAKLPSCPKGQSWDASMQMCM